MFYLSKQAFDKKTIYSRARNIELLQRNGANPQDPDSVLAVLATNDRWKSGTKNNILQAYKSYAKWNKIDISGIDLPKFKRARYIASKTANKDLLRIHPHTFRHFFATKLYLQTRDIRYVQKKMGHRSITSTTIYENSEPNQDGETHMVKAVTSREEAETLIALGYEFHYRTADGVDLFRKKVTGLD